MNGQGDWRPQCHPCNKGEAWIGYQVSDDVVVGSAYAKGLGVSYFLVEEWTGGVKLQERSDNVTRSNLQTAVDSDRVATPGAVVKYFIFFSHCFSFSSVYLHIRHNTIYYILI